MTFQCACLPCRCSSMRSTSTRCRLAASCGDAVKFRMSSARRRLSRRSVIGAAVMVGHPFRRGELACASKQASGGGQSVASLTHHEARTMSRSLTSGFRASTSRSRHRAVAWGPKKMSPGVASLGGGGLQSHAGCRGARGSGQDAARAVSAARVAFDEGPWPRMSPEERGAHLHRLADLIEQHTDELVATETTDMGKPVTESASVTCRARLRTSASSPDPIDDYDEPGGRRLPLPGITCMTNN